MKLNNKQNLQKTMTTNNETAASWLNEESIMALAWGKSDERGHEYYQAGAVDDIMFSRGWVIAQVSGSYIYEVRLQVDGPDPQWQCDCPVGEDGLFCKHCVAVALAWLERLQSGEADMDEAEKLRQYLNKQTKGSLVEQFLYAAEQYPELRQQLKAEITVNTDTLNLKQIKPDIRQALSVLDFVDYRGMGHFLANAMPVVDMLQKLVDQGRAKDALPLIQYALELGLNNLENTDDSDGGFGDLIGDLSMTFNEACLQARPEPAGFARDFFKLRLFDGWDYFSLQAYQDVLGKNGLAEYRQLVQQEWDKVPVKKSVETGNNYYGKPFSIRMLMEELAKHDGDIDALVAIKARDLSNVYAYTDIASTLFEARRKSEAIDWAERGYKAFRNEHIHGLIDFLIMAYHNTGRHADAETMAWDEFRQSLNFHGYQSLKKSAGKNQHWPECRQKAMTLLQQQLKKESGKPKTKSLLNTGQPAVLTTLLEILLWEKNIDEAVVLMKHHGCPLYLTDRMAKACEKTYQAEAIKLYQQEIERMIDRRNNDSYAKAAKMVKKVGNLYKQLKQKMEYEKYVAEIKTRHKAKRNFIRCMDEVGK